MKLVTTYLLLFTYSITMLKPYLPYVSDAIAHVFWYSDHIATIHSHDGKFHVHKEIIEAAKSTETEKNSKILKKDNNMGDCIITKEFNIISQKHFNKKYYPPLPSHFISTYLSSDFPPPKV